MFTIGILLRTCEADPNASVPPPSVPFPAVGNGDFAHPDRQLLTAESARFFAPYVCRQK